MCRRADPIAVEAPPIALQSHRVEAAVTRSKMMFTALWAGLCLVSSVATSAQESRLLFSGSITEGTCSTSTASAAPNWPAGRAVGSCASRPGTLSAGRIYASASRPLAALEADPALHYFDAYVVRGQPNAAHPILLTQTYD